MRLSQRRRRPAAAAVCNISLLCAHKHTEPPWKTRRPDSSSTTCVKQAAAAFAAVQMSPEGGFPIEMIAHPISTSSSLVHKQPARQPALTRFCHHASKHRCQGMLSMAVLATG